MNFRLRKDTAQVEKTVEGRQGLTYCEDRPFLLIFFRPGPLFGTEDTLVWRDPGTY